jgi:hypothetical protein
MPIVKAGHISHTWSVFVRLFLIRSYIIIVVETVSLRKSTSSYSCYVKYSNGHPNLQLVSKHYLCFIGILFVRSLVLTQELTRNQPGGQWSLSGVRFRRGGLFQTGNQKLSNQDSTEEGMFFLVSIEFKCISRVFFYLYGLYTFK